MKISGNTNNKKRTIIISSVVAVLLLATVVSAVFYRSYQNDKSANEKVNLDPPTDEEKSAGDSAKTNTVSPNTDKGNTSGSDSTPTPSTNGDKASVGGEITSANQNGAVFQIRALIHTVTGDGTCTLSMKGPDGKIYTSTAGVQPLPSSTTCKGFDVPVSSLAIGQWKATITFSNDQYTASTEKDIIIQ